MTETERLMELLAQSIRARRQAQRVMEGRPLLPDHINPFRSIPLGALKGVVHQ